MGVDADNRPVGVVEQAGQQIRPWFVPTLDKTGQTGESMKDFLPATTHADQN